MRVSVSGTCATQTTILIHRPPTLSFIDPPSMRSSTPHPIPPHVGGGERTCTTGSALLIFEALEQESPVGTPEAEGVGEGVADLGLAGLVGDDVEVAGGILVLEVDGRGQGLVAESEGGDPRLEPARGAQQVARHGLGRAD